MEVRKGTIKKPKFIPTYVVSVVIMLAVLFAIAFLLTLPGFVLYVSEAESECSDYRNSLDDGFFEIMDKEEIAAEDLVKIKAGAVGYYTQTKSKCKIKVDGYGVFDSGKTAFLEYAYWTDNNDMDTFRSQLLMLADNKVYTLGTDNLADVLNDDFMAGRGEAYDRIMAVCRRFSLTSGWTPPSGTKIILYHSNEDDTVPYENLTAMEAFLDTAAPGSYTVSGGNDGGHVNAAVNFVLNLLFEW